MLTKMPQVGDKVRCIRENYLIDVSVGTVYDITDMNYGSDALFLDDVGAERYIDVDRFDKFELVSEAHDALPPQPVGRITLENVQRTTKVSADGHETSYAFTVYADADGYDAVERLADLSAKQDKRTDIERQIAALQKELAAL